MYIKIRMSIYKKKNNPSVNDSPRPEDLFWGGNTELALQAWKTTQWSKRGPCDGTQPATAERQPPNGRRRP